MAPPVWRTGGKTYAMYFAESRSPPPLDKVESVSLNPHEPFSQADRTTKITLFDPSALQYQLGSATLDFAFVQNVLANTGPVYPIIYAAMWQFAESPAYLDLHHPATHEASFYSYLRWQLCNPGTHAVNAVRDELHRAANQPLPTNLSECRTVHKTGGAAGIIHYLPEVDASPSCTPHEFKRAKVLRVDGVSVLDFLVQKAKSEYIGTFNA
ncbi:hypothetical protein C8R45DRAFT_1109403 [Mycena sanguinolenta]|nr:hypothetical protein C8R45DRAFT_1109403 [Mycena sanguinolenta]